MKKILLIIVMAVMVLLNDYTVCASDFSYIRDELNELGINEEYSDNIIKYLNSLNLSDDDISGIIENTNDIVKYTSEINNDNGNIIEYYNIYSKGMEIADILDLYTEVDIQNKEITLIDGNTEDILYKGDIESVKKLYSEYKKMNYSLDINELAESLSSDDTGDEILLNKSYISDDSVSASAAYDGDSDLISDMYEGVNNSYGNSKNNIDEIDKFAAVFSNYNKETLSYADSDPLANFRFFTIISLIVIIMAAISLLMIKIYRKKY